MAIDESPTQINQTLARMYPDARCELDFTTPLELLIATVLSAQTTDVRVNLITPELFATYPTAAAYARANPEEIERIIRSTGMYRNKTKALIGIGQSLERDHGGKVPPVLEELIKLPGVGRKTANVVLGNAFNIPGITVDTHVARVSRRLGWTSKTDPLALERDLQELFEPSEWTMLCHRLIFHGRYCCTARTPQCGSCDLAPVCPAAGPGAAAVR